MELITTLKDSIVIIRKPVKRISLKVKANLDVILCVPLHTPDDYIEQLIANRSSWITKQLDYFKLRIKPVNRLISGEEIKFLGVSYRLKVIKSGINKIELADGYIVLTTPRIDDISYKQKLMDNWYKLQAYEYFGIIINKYQGIIGKQVHKLTVRKMTSRWGSCNPKLASINLNLDLIKQSPAVIEYVIMHELTHLTHYYHDKNFYNYLTNYMPDWKHRRQKLNSPA